MIKGALALVGVSVLAYVYFFVPLGQRTLFEHTQRIASTDEARELGDEAEQAADRLADHLEGEIDEHITHVDAAARATSH